MNKADVSFVAALHGYVLSFFVHEMPLLQGLALVTTVVSGICAAYYHLKKARIL